MSTEAFALGPIRQIAITVHDLERSKAFYRDQLGLRLLLEVPRMAFFDCHGVWLMLSLPEGAETDHPGSVLYFEVGDIHAAHAALRERGVEFIDQPRLIADMGSYALWMSFFRAPEGTLLAIRAEIPKG